MDVRSEDRRPFPGIGTDPQSVRGRVEAMERLMRGRTTFMVAHRVTTLRQCDLLLGIDQGRLAWMRSDVPAAIRDLTAGGIFGAGAPGPAATPVGGLT